MRKKNIYVWNLVGMFMFVRSMSAEICSRCCVSKFIKNDSKHKVETVSKANCSLYWRIQREERERRSVEVFVEWKEMKKIKDLDLEIAVDKRISELKNLSTKEKSRRSMAIWSKFISGNVNEKRSSGGSSQDVDVGKVSSKFFLWFSWFSGSILALFYAFVRVFRKGFFLRFSGSCHNSIVSMDAKKLFVLSGDVLHLNIKPKYKGHF